MPRRDFKLSVEDVLQAIEKIQRYTAGMSFENFQGDDKTVDAVVRNITIIGEAARNVPEEITATHLEIPWAEMRDIRNIVVHRYFGVSLPILWETIHNDLPPLTEKLKKLLSDQAG